jgi:peptidoglycan/LPS O-acetylase OafA/YrhL
MSGAPAPAALSGEGAGTRMPELDSLRGLAAVGILLLHAFPVQLFWWWSLVDLFFLLSGFLITGILLRVPIGQPRVLRNFWIRRVLRIWPVYYLSLLGAIAVTVLYVRAGMPPLPLGRWLRCALFLQFAEGYRHGGAVDLSVYAPWFRHSWSVAAEEQFYVLWPFALLLLGRGRLRVAATCAALLAAGICLRQHGYLVILLLTRVDGLALGALLALMHHAPAGLARHWRLRAYALAALAAAPLAARYLWQGYGSSLLRNYNDIAQVGDWTFNVTAFALLYFALLGAVLDGVLPRLAALLRLQPLVYLGGISYAVYMYQGPVRGLLGALWFRDEAGSTVLNLLTIPLVIGLAALSRRLVEQPCEAYKHRFPLRTPVHTA